MRRVDGVGVGPDCSSVAPRLLEERPCPPAITGGVEDPAPLQQVPDTQQRRILIEHRLDGVEKGVRLGDVAKQPARPRHLRQHLSPRLRGAVEQHPQPRLRRGGILEVPALVDPAGVVQLARHSVRESGRSRSIISWTVGMPVPG